MKIGLVYNYMSGTNVNYRGLWAAEALGRMGHSAVIVPLGRDGRFAAKELLTCDAVHVYRWADRAVMACVDALRARGVGITWDIDDDCRLIPRESPSYKDYGGLKGAREFANQIKMMNRADLVTTTTDYLADRLRATTQTPVVAIDNYLDRSQFAKPVPHPGVVIGWAAAHEHRADVARLRLVELLREVMDADSRIRVATLGIRLKLDPDRYSFNAGVPLQELASHMRQFDIGIAPLGDVPFNFCRSAVKLKEYAAAGVPWLASDRGPYSGLDSTSCGGITLSDDEQWRSALLALAASSEKRETLRRKGMAWAETQRMERNVEQWLAVWSHAAAQAQRRVA
jgi:glycosyltransferase involved in cell wall biosynthesis